MGKTIAHYFIIAIFFFSLIEFITCQNLKKLKKNKRLLQEDEDPEETEVPFKNLKIYYDLVSLNGNIEGHDNWIKNKGIFITAMNEVKEILEEYIEIRDDEEQDILEDIDEWNIGVFDEDFFKERSNMNLYNCYIFFKVSTLNEEDSIASAKIIMTDDYDTPKLGIITLNQNLPEIEFPLNFFKTLLLHQITHLLGFHIRDFDFVIGIDTDEEEGKYIMTKDNYPKVINYAKEYFNCKDEDVEIEIELELDADNNIHWPSRLLLGEYMTKFNYFEEQVISGFTLAFFEGLDYINIKKKYTGGLFRFGKYKGCNFLKNNCGIGEKLTYANEFYLPENIVSSYLSSPEASCSSGRLSKTIHKVYHYDTIPYSYEYLKGEYAGPSWMNYCPISEYQNDNKLENVYQKRCSNDINYEKSFCVLDSLTKEETEKTIIAQCYSMSCSEKSLTIQIGEEYIVCPRSGGKIKIDGYNGYLLCPDYNLICTGTQLCNDIFDCIEKKSEEKTSILQYDYSILTTQDSSEYLNSPVSTDGYELSEDGICPINCIKCNVNKCLICVTYYHPENNICVANVLNCEAYEDENNCKICKSGFDQVFQEDNKLSCIILTNDEKNKIYYTENIDGHTYYKKCSKAINNCNECLSSTICTKCKDGFSTIGDDKSKCEDLSTNKYYYDSNEQIYKSCSNKMDNCNKCTMDNNNFNCLECSSGFKLLYDIIVECKESSLLENNNEYFSNENGDIYYKCSNNFYHSVSNCRTCNNKDTCITCQAGFSYFNNGKLCISSQEMESYYMEGNALKLCSEAIIGCNKCSSSIKCNKCQDNFELDENDKCIHVSLISIKYYYNPTIGKYINCNKLEKCDECSSEETCTRCIDGYQAQEGKCKKIEFPEMEDKDHDKLMSLAIAGIVLGTIAIVGVLLVIIYIIWDKFFLKKKISNMNANTNVIELKNSPSENNLKAENEVVGESTKKRSIHN